MLAKLFNAFMPRKRPEIVRSILLDLAKQNGINIDRDVFVVGIRGFFNKGQNQRKIYDDALFIVTPGWPSPVVVGFNANTDAGAFKRGIANLVCGTWLYKIGIHGLSKPKFLQYKAGVQAGNVTVMRDGKGLDTGKFGINIHKGGYTKVSSLGCQTIAPEQWDEFIASLRKNLESRNQEVFKYILKEM